MLKRFIFLIVIFVVIIECNYYNFYISIFYNKYGKKISYTLKYNITSPIWECPTYIYKETNFTSQFNEDKFIINYFIKNRLNPFNRIFLEIGAFDGFDMSNTYALEHGYGWRGLLIEAGPLTFQILIKTYRPRSIKVNAAVCSDEGFVEFIDNQWGRGGLKNYRDNFFYGNKKVKVKCSPISKLIKHNGLRYIDVFSLDVEGGEESLLKTFDWNIPVRIWIIEVNALKVGGSELEKQRCIKVQNMLKEHGYKYLGMSANNSVNEFYYDPYFDEKIKTYINEENEVFRIKKCR